MLSIATAAVWDLARGTGLSENMMDLVWLICVRCLWDCSWNIGARGTNRGVTDIGATRHGIRCKYQGELEKEEGGHQ